MTEDIRSKIEAEVNYALSIRENKPHEALNMLKKLDEEYPEQAALTGLVAGTYFLLKDWNQALPYFTASVRLSPKSELASIGLFQTLVTWGLKKKRLTKPSPLSGAMD